MESPFSSPIVRLLKARRDKLDQQLRASTADKTNFGLTREYDRLTHLLRNCTLGPNPTKVEDHERNQADKDRSKDLVTETAGAASGNPSASVPKLTKKRKASEDLFIDFMDRPRWIMSCH